MDTESAYMDKLTKQREALSDLILERQKLLETQEQFKRLQRADAMTQVGEHQAYFYHKTVFF